MVYITIYINIFNYIQNFALKYSILSANLTHKCSTDIICSTELHIHRQKHLKNHQAKYDLKRHCTTSLNIAGSILDGVP
jgi:hypothetical protein